MNSQLKKNIRVPIKFFFFYSFLFVLLYYEDRIEFNNISLSNIWKSFTVLIFVVYVISKKLHGKIEKFDWVIFLLIISFLINGYGFLSIVDLEEIVILSILPISYYSFYYVYRKKNNDLLRVIIFLSCFLILSSIPFIFKILEPPQVLEYSLDYFGQRYQFDNSILVGFFKHPSISSKVFVFSTIVIWILGIKNSSFKNTTKLIFGILLIIGILDIYLSFTRTGWIMLIIFVLSFILSEKHSGSLKKLILASIIVFSLFYIYNNNESIQNRVMGYDIFNTSNYISITSFTSGRDILFIRQISSVFDNDFKVMFLGLGKQMALIKNQGALAHNRFLEILGYGGLLSLSLYIVYLYLIYNEIKKYKNSNIVYTLAISSYLIMILSLIPSHGLPIWADVIFGGIIALNRIQYEITNN